MLSIGTFSRATHLSVRTLRRYHEQGLLVPAGIDPATGYRSYRREQIFDAQLIHRLREVDLPLPAVTRIVDARDPALTGTLLSEHLRALHGRRSEIEQMIAGVGSLLAGSSPLDVGVVHLREQRAEPVLVVRGRPAERDFADFFREAFGRLGRHAHRHRLTVSGPGGARFPDREWDPDAVETVVVLPVTAPVAGPGVEVGTLPSGRLAAVLHAGDYAGVALAHAALGSWAATHGVEADSSLQELYLVGPHDTSDPAAWRTEVGWLVGTEPHTPEEPS